MKKFLSITLGIFITFSFFANVAFASVSGQDEFDRVNSTQAVTQPTQEEIQASIDKTEAVKLLYNAVQSYSCQKITKEELKKTIDSYNAKYKTNLSIDKVVNVPSANGVTSKALTLSPSYYLLGWSCTMQTKNWYCGPASAYNLLHGQGITSYNGRTLSQDNLATDLGAVYVGAPWTGTWATTMSNWSRKTYVTTSGPSAFDIMTDAWNDCINSLGTIYDTYMSGTNQLVGYATGSTRYHYVAGDGYDQSNNTVHYLDCNNQNNAAFGKHWISASMMANCTATRGIVW